MADENNETRLVEAAIAARERAFAPYSKFKVGAALETADGRIYTGCNVESASYGLSMCAERVAIWTAVAAGERDFKSITVAADTETLTPPCGACRQVIWEFCRDVPVIMVNLHGRSQTVRMSELLPDAFDADFLA